MMSEPMAGCDRGAGAGTGAGVSAAAAAGAAAAAVALGSMKGPAGSSPLSSYRVMQPANGVVAASPTCDGPGVAGPGCDGVPAVPAPAMPGPFGVGLNARTAPSATAVPMPMHAPMHMPLMHMPPMHMPPMHMLPMPPSVPGDMPTAGLPMAAAGGSMPPYGVPMGMAYVPMMPAQHPACHPIMYTMMGGAGGSAAATGVHPYVMAAPPCAMGTSTPSPMPGFPYTSHGMWGMAQPAGVPCSTLTATVSAAPAAASAVVVPVSAMEQRRSAAAYGLAGQKTVGIPTSAGGWVQ